MDDKQKSFFLQLAFDTKFCHTVFVNVICTMQNQRDIQRGVRLAAHLAIESLMANYCIRWRIIFKGLSPRMEDKRIFLKNLRNMCFNKDLLNEPTFDLIHLAGQYLFKGAQA